MRLLGLFIIESLINNGFYKEGKDMNKTLKKSVIAVVSSLALMQGVATAGGYDEGDFILRVGAAYINPNDSSSPILGGEVGVGNELGLGFSGTYMLSNSWGLEVLAALPFSHDLTAKGGPYNGAVIGETKHLPPTVTFQYYPEMGSSSFVQPYFGVGINYTKFFSEKSSAALQTVLSSTDVKLDLDDSFGLAAEIGADWKLGNGFALNTSLKYIQIDTTADIIVNGSRAASVDVDVNPFVAMVGLTWTF